MEHTRREIRWRISKIDRQYNDRKKNNIKTNNDPQNTSQTIEQHEPHWKPG